MQKNPFLEILPEEKVIIPVMSDTHAVVTESDIVFMSYLQPEFNNAKFDYPLTFTPETAVDRFQTIAEGNFYDYFNSFEIALDKLVLSANQIIDYCDRQRQNIRSTHSTYLFLYMRRNEYYVASVRSYAQGQVLRVYAIQDKCTCSVEGNYCVVVPSIASN